MTIALGPALNQKDQALHPFDIDDCWVVAGLQAGRAVGANITGVDIPAFRKAANRPDNPNQANPGSAADVMRGAHTLWPTLRISQSSTVFATYRAALVKQGKVSVLLVMSGKLAPDHQYGFKGFHAITVRYAGTVNGGRFYGINPLQPKGSSASEYSEAELKAAAEAYPDGVQAVLFAPAPPPVLPDPDTTPYSQEDLDDAHEQGRVEGIQSVIDAAEALL